MKNKKLFCVLFFALILALSCVFVSAEEIETPETELSEEELVGIEPQIHAISIVESNVSLKRGQGVKLTVSYNYSQGAITWTSSSSCVVVTADGYIRGVSAGTATITAWNYSAPSGYIRYDTCTVTVSGTPIIESEAYALVSSFDSFDTWFPFEGSRYPSDNASVNVGSSLGRTGYTWWITLGSDGLYTIRSMYSLKYLKCYNDSITAGTQISRASGAGSAGCKWSVMEIANGSYAFIPSSSSNANVRLGVEMTEDETHMVLLNYSAYNHEDTEWNLIRMLPTCGGELPYCSDDISNRTTDYQYAFNYYTIIGYPNAPVSDIHEGFTGEEPLSFGENDSVMLLDAVMRDVEYLDTHLPNDFSFYEIGRYDYCNEGEYKVALLVGEEGHLWLRQDSDGFWSYFTYGGEIARFQDDNGDAIIDPKYAYFSDYDSCVGYFAVTPWN